MSQIELKPLPGTKGPDQRVERFEGVTVSPGLYKFHWKSGGSSLVAIGMMHDGQWWVAPTNWISPAQPLPIGPSPYTSWQDVSLIERIEDTRPLPSADRAEPVGETPAVGWKELPHDDPFVIAMSQPLSEKTEADLKAIDENIRAAQAAASTTFVGSHSTGEG